jgi:hypothetical protein
VTNNALDFLIVGILLGALPGFLVGQQINCPDTLETESTQIPNPYPVPETKAECYVAIAEASTNTGADAMDEYCFKTFGGL